jgi:hypothetical protein
MVTALLLLKRFDGGWSPFIAWFYAVGAKRSNPSTVRTQTRGCILQVESFNMIVNQIQISPAQKLVILPENVATVGFDVRGESYV